MVGIATGWVVAMMQDEKSYRDLAMDCGINLTMCESGGVKVWSGNPIATLVSTEEPWPTIETTVTINVTPQGDSRIKDGPIMSVNEVEGSANLYSSTSTIGGLSVLSTTTLAVHGNHHITLIQFEGKK